MQITKAELERTVKKAYSLGYDDCANQNGYNIAYQQGLIEVHRGLEGYVKRSATMSAGKGLSDCSRG